MAQWSLDFDGTDDFVGCGDLPGGTGALTVECWVRLDVDDAAQGIVCKWDAASAAEQEYSLEADAGGNYVFKITTATSAYSVSAAISVGVWQHLAGVYDGDELRLYVDGVEADADGVGNTVTNAAVTVTNAAADVSQTRSNIITTTQPLEFGRTDALEYMTGGLAYVRISDSARYTAGFTVPKIPAFVDANTLGQWDFIEGRPLSVLNNRESTAAYDGVIDGALWSLDLPEDKWGSSYGRWGDAWTIFVDGIDRTSVIALDSLTITMETGSGRDVAQFRIEDVTTAVTVEAWQPVQIWHGGTLMFGGVLVRHEVIVRGVTRDIMCECVDWTALLGKRWGPPKAYVGETCAAILADVYASAAPEIDATTYVEAGETLDFEVSFEYLDEITGKLAEASGFAWYVREDEEGVIYLYFQAEAPSNRSAFDLSTSPDMVMTFPMQVLSWPVSGSEIINYIQFVITEEDNTQTLTGTQNIASIAKYGQLEWVGKISRSQAEAYTTNWLADAAYEKSSGQIRIWQAGIMPGTYINIEHVVLDVDATYLVSRVKVRPEGGSAINFDLTVGSVDVGLSNHLSSLRRVSAGTEPVVSSASGFPYGIITESIRPFADSAAGFTFQNATGIGLITLDTVNNIFKPLGYIDGGMFASGTSGYRLNGTTGDAEFNNATIRGALGVTTLQYGQVLATNGSIWITPVAGRSIAAITSVDSPATFDVDIEDPDGLSHVAAGAMWAANDIIRVKEPLGGDLWAKISSTSDQTTFWRLACVKQSPGAGTNYTFTSGGAVLNYKQSGAGMIRLTADASNSPYISIATHAGAPWSTLTERARLGNLTGVTGASGYGLWTDNGFFTGTIYATSGEIGGWTIASTSLTDTAGTVGMSSSVTAGDDIRFWAGHVTPGSAPFRVTEAGALTASSGEIGGWTLGATSLTDTAGTTGMSSSVTAGDDIRFWAGHVTPGSAPFRVTEAGALTATDATITGAITASSGSITGFLTLGSDGGIYQGSGTSGSPTTGLKIWNDGGTGRIAGYNGSVLQWYADTDGKLYAGGGDVLLDADGIAIELSTDSGGALANSYHFVTSAGSERASWRVYEFGSVSFSTMQHNAGSTSATSSVQSYSTNQAVAQLLAEGSSYAALVATEATATSSKIDLKSVLVEIDGASGSEQDADVTVFGTITIDQSNDAGGVPALILEQTDVSEEMIRFLSTAGTGNTIEAVGGKTLTTTHFIKVNVNGSIRYIPVGTIA